MTPKREPELWSCSDGDEKLNHSCMHDAIEEWLEG